MPRPTLPATAPLAPFDDQLAAIYGGAVAATEDRERAAEITVSVVATGMRDGRRLVAEAVRQAVLSAPCAPFHALPPDERVALALARLAGLDVTEIAALTSAPAAEVKARLTTALCTLRAAPRAQLSACA